jgi:hypothetical protein
MADDAGQPNAVDDASLISGLRGKLQYLRNQKTPSGLLPAEDKLIVAAVAGNTCTLGSGTRPKLFGWCGLQRRAPVQKLLL